MELTDRINNNLRTLAPHISKLQTAILLREAVAEIKILTQDKKRLDWLADSENALGCVQLPTKCVQAHLDDMRAAIDAAMRINDEPT